MRKIIFFALIVFNSFSFYSQNETVFRIDSIPGHYGKVKRSYGLKFPEKWKYKKGDDTTWAGKDINDSAWQYLNTNLNVDTLAADIFDGVGWFRLSIAIDSTLIDRAFGLMMEQKGASEVYLDGKLIHKFGKIDKNMAGKETRFNPKNIPVDIIFRGGTKHILAVKYANTNALKDFASGETDWTGFEMKIGVLRDAVFFTHIGFGIVTSIYIFYFTFFLALGIVHLMLFLHYKSIRSNLYFSVFSLAFGAFFLFIAIQINFLDPDFTARVNYLHGFLHIFYIPALLAMLYTVFNNNKLPKIFWLWAGIFALNFLLRLFHIYIPYGGVLYNAIVIIEPLRIVITAMVKKRDGAWIIGTGIISTIVFFILFFTLPFFTSGAYLNLGYGMSLFLNFIVIYFTLNIPLSMTLVLARNFAKTSNTLSKKLVEVEELSAKTIEQEKERQKILETQNEVLEMQVTERTKEISEQKKLIEEKNKDITDSINYAKRLQEAILPPLSFISEKLPESFVLYKPKDIVAGDFYWMESFAKAKDSEESSKGEIILIAAADCTGHGVPGAMVSVVCSNALNRAVKEFGITEPGKILDKVRELVIETFQKSTADVKDGMDISLVSIQKKKSEKSGEYFVIEWAGANNPLWFIQNGEHKEITAHKQSIGKTDLPTSFPTHTITLNRGDTLFLFTDGYADQFGGPKGKKYKYKQLLDLLSSSNKVTMEKMKELLNDSIENWKGSLEQIDDICIIGIRL